MNSQDQTFARTNIHTVCSVLMLCLQYAKKISRSIDGGLDETDKEI